MDYLFNPSISLSVEGSVCRCPRIRWMERERERGRERERERRERERREREDQ
jgi:hypothetical protein